MTDPGATMAVVTREALTVAQKASLAIDITAIGYDGRWNSTDQVPERAITDGRLPRFGAVDPSDGGASHRYSLSGEFQSVGAQSVLRASAYVLDYRLDLFSNFTYFLADTTRGDQIEQRDDRFAAGARIAYSTSDDWLGGRLVQTVGLEIRHDDIGTLGLAQVPMLHALGVTVGPGPVLALLLAAVFVPRETGA